jgi:hypothetical protein
VHHRTFIPLLNLERPEAVRLKHVPDKLLLLGNLANSLLGSQLEKRKRENGRTLQNFFRTSAETEWPQLGYTDFLSDSDRHPYRT